MLYSKALIVLLSTLVLAGCWEEEVAAPEPEPRMVRTIVAEQADAILTRSFPAVLQPPELTPLAFDVGGRLGPIDLRIGQEVAEGDVLATVEAEDAALRLQQAEAALAEAEIATANAREEANRQQALFERNVASASARDRALTQADQADARVTQAARNLDLVRATLGDTSLRAPFDGIIDGISVQAFGSVQPGQQILTLYEDTGLQATILVSFEVVTSLELGQTVSVVPTDGDATPLPATLTEIGRRAAAVSSFPIVVTLDEARPELRSGMAVEVVFDLPIPEARQGIELPLSSLALGRDVAMDEAPFAAQVFVAHPDDDDRAQLDLTNVTLGAVSEDLVYVTQGLAVGDRVVTAGVSFLDPGQVVRILPDTDPENDELTQ
ncbi:efflux RND transporter periplasmic adaptor subunit [Celeribacter baekdonensis]|uniref:RND family efflux transporter MFP subunit n=1 Tax=Celeribacter baekdonensis B30 TaxID=1208323 RepID=K2J0J2_9RHOB|nr:efflux RND transporter periplasmic adaptor subunit [Celeribacter baekdonensis]EKE68322.1 RND family efflux transporter MFP subunit [Celeribacter baekdonensis B30]